MFIDYLRLGLLFVVRCLCLFRFAFAGLSLRLFGLIVRALRIYLFYNLLVWFGADCDVRLLSLWSLLLGLILWC